MNFVRNRKAVSASRASLNGIAGHQAAMKAISNGQSRGDLTPRPGQGHVQTQGDIRVQSERRRMVEGSGLTGIQRGRTVDNQASLDEQKAYVNEIMNI